ncbi:serine/threonine-protein kinase [Candidatus Protofrankia californiensis]|uniref:serine/threonine-protein kinase n=1 Tax=Candidatus Protofrankia californiensis TaxID=1839754 RepID=UPI0013EC015B|nr:serine/threonine-protein kinase [Candidatus Protofrankia californiensis]
MPVDRNRVERVLPDRYELHGRLSGGGFGDVFKVLDRRLDRFVAVKAVTLEGPDGHRRAGDEAKVLAQLNHPHLVNIFDAVDVDGLFLLFMEFVSGKALDKVSGGLPPETVCGIGLAAADALAYVHGKHMLHRDIKPANLLLADDGTLKIVDFGIAKLLEHTAAFGRTGTPFWMAPEQRNFAALGPGTDLYSLGLVLYGLFAGRLPARPRVGPLTGVHEALAGVVMRALEDDIQARYPAAHEFAVDLAEAATEALEPGWLKRSNLILRVDDAIRDAATQLPDRPPPPPPPPPINQSRPAARVLSGEGTGSPRPAVLLPRTPPPAPPIPGGLAHDRNQSRRAGGGADRAGGAPPRGYRAVPSPAASVDHAARRGRRPLAIGVVLMVLLATAVTTVVLRTGSSSPPRTGSSSLLITAVAGTGTAGFSGDGGPATQARLSDPSGIAVDSTGTLYITDQGNHRVRRVKGQ